MATENLTTAPNKLIDDAKQDLLAKLDASINWYSKSGRQRGWWARWLRVSMIVFGGVSAITPTISQIKTNGWPEISPLWASVFITLTATIFAFEKFYGHSEAWMRFILAKQELERLREDFLLSWLRLSVIQPTQSDSKSTLDELMRVSAARHEIVKKETETWTKVFENGLKSSTPSTTDATSNR